jgi:hypothetical protein
VQVTVIGPTYPFRGGIAHYTTLLVRTLRTAGHQVDFLSFRRQYPQLLFPGRTDRDPSRAVLQEPCENRGLFMALKGAKETKKFSLW